MAISFSNLGASASPDFSNIIGGTSFSTASWTPPASGLILLVVENGEGFGFNDPATVSGNGLTWVQIGTATYEFDETIEWDLSRLTLYAANASGSSAGQTTITFADPQSRCEASFFHAAGVDLSGGVLGAFRTPIHSQVGNAASAQINLQVPLNSNNRPIAAFAHRVNGMTSPRTNWTEMDDLASTSAIGLETQVRQDAFETVASASWSGISEWGAFAVELKAAAVGSTPMAVFVHHLKQQGIS